MVVGKLDGHTQKNEIRHLSHTIHKKLTQNGLKLECKTETIKLLKGNIGSILFDLV